MTLRDAKTAPRMLVLRQPFRYVLLQCTFCSQPEVSTTSGSKVMAQKVIFKVFDVFDLELDITMSFDF